MPEDLPIGGIVLIMKKVASVIVATLLVMVLCVPALAGDTALVQIQGPKSVQTGDLCVITVSAQDADSLNADINTSGLELVSFGGDLSTARDIFLLKGFSPSAITYRYRVTAQPGETARFWLTNCTAMHSGVAQTCDAAPFEAPVTDANIWTNPSTRNVTFNGQGDSAQGGTCRITVSTTELAMAGNIEVSGLKFDRVYCEGYPDMACLSDENHVILVKDSSGPVATFEYTITASPGDTAWFRLKNVHISDGNGDTDLPDAYWSATVDDRALISGEVQLNPDGKAVHAMLGGYLGTIIGTQSNPVTVQAFSSYFEQDESEHVALFDGSGIQMDEDAIVGTGCQARLVNADGQTVDTATVVMRGDVTGSGMITLSQLVHAAGAFRGTTTLENAYAAAADWNANGTIDLSDIVLQAKLLKQ